MKLISMNSTSCNMKSFFLLTAVILCVLICVRTNSWAVCSGKTICQLGPTQCVFVRQENWGPPYGIVSIKEKWVNTGGALEDLTSVGETPGYTTSSGYALEKRGTWLAPIGFTVCIDPNAWACPILTACNPSNPE